VLRIFSSIILGSKTRSWPCYLFYVLSVVAVFLGVDRVPEDIPERIWTKWRNESLGVHDEPARSHRSRKYLSALLAAESIGFISKRTVQGGRPRLIHVPAADRCSTDGRPLEMVEAYSLLAQPAKRPIPTSLHPSPPNPSAIPAYSIDPRVGGSVPPSPTEDLRKSYLDLGHANQVRFFDSLLCIRQTLIFINLAFCFPHLLCNCYRHPLHHRKRILTTDYPCIYIPRTLKNRSLSVRGQSHLDEHWRSYRTQETVLQLLHSSPVRSSRYAHRRSP
jgi:hypothetical protein